MLILKPNAPKRIPVRSFYSGNRGFYCSMYPTNDTLNRIVQHFKTVPQLVDRLVAPSLMHVTIMHSDQSIPMEELPWINRDAVIPSAAKGYDFFCKPHATEGAVVMLLESEGLEQYHAELSLMAEYSWDEFKPHMTLAYGVNPTDAATIISTVAAMPLLTNLNFTAPVFEDKT